ncbi:hypothetical protein BC629DRAFT_1715839 [Irpex lacteus]|nr:hypothetical protein BC629DRAFT_1715839 [Irpex lacteus]
MPTAVASNGPQSAATPKKPSQRSKKSRLVRRRGRIHSGSDDEIEREARSDSDSDDHSSLDSESDSETASDDEHHAGIVTPSTTQSPPPLEINGQSSSLKPDPIVAGGSGPFSGATDWAQIVADENATGAGELPVIDFADMHTHTEPKAQKQAKKAAAAHSVQEQLPTQPDKVEEEQPHEADDDPVSSTPAPAVQDSSQPRSRGQSVRQAYQERLRQDPAYIPRVGEFWGHDDRLLDKDLRSMSGWWRGRWHNRGRGRGSFPLRGRGGRDFFAGRVLPQEGHEAPDDNGFTPVEDVPPIERAWGHDGFEEMKRREEQRKEEHRLSQTQPTGPHRGAAPRGRAGFVPRGRGGAIHGGRSASPQLPTAPLTSTHSRSIWTKHAESFLYVDASVRVKLPGRAARVLPAQQLKNKPESTRGTSEHSAPSMTNLSEDGGERQFVVRFPKALLIKQKRQSRQRTMLNQSELSIDEVFTVRPHAVPSYVPLNVLEADGQTESPPLSQRRRLGIGNTVASDAPPSAILEETLLRHPSHEEPVEVSQPSADEPRGVPPPLHPLQTSFSPVPPTSPPYGSPYGYGASLPPGIAMSPQGFPYEITTGRPVYLQHAPPPMYAPQPAHMSHPSQEYVPQPHTPVNGFVDPATGVPIFSPARQNSRIEIRAPTDRSEGTTTKSASRHSNLRTSVTEGESDATEGLTTEAAGAAQLSSQSQQQPPLVPYAHYPAQYYYPDPNAYNAYMDMTPQMHYELYPPHDQRSHQPIIYY